jgi:hypothetical protein
MRRGISDGITNQRKVKEEGLSRQRGEIRCTYL